MNRGGLGTCQSLGYGLDVLLPSLVVEVLDAPFCECISLQYMTASAVDPFPVRHKNNCWSNACQKAAMVHNVPPSVQGNEPGTRLISNSFANFIASVVQE